MSTVGNSKVQPRNKRPGVGGQRGMKHKGFDKSVLTEGIYANHRLTHVATSMIGCEVQIEVKNGTLYEGIFKTFSPTMEMVLDLAHKVDTTSQETKTATPTKEKLVDTLVFPWNTIVRLSSYDVELDYAEKDSFTDAAISSKHNGESKERELTPWDGGPDNALESLETTESTSSSSNGWDPNEMFKTNADQFNVKSSYDPSLSQYTTPLKVENTSEYKKRAEEAERLAREIEGSDVYKKRIDMENGDGDGDEEDKFSAVHRPASCDRANNGKYVPPHLRSKNSHGERSEGSRGPDRSGRGDNRPDPAKSDRGDYARHEEQSVPQSVAGPQQRANKSSPGTPNSGEFEPKQNTEKERRDSEKNNASNAQMVPNTNKDFNNKDKEQSPPVRKTSNPGQRAPAVNKDLIQNLKDFSHNFKLDDPKKAGVAQGGPTQQTAIPSPKLQDKIPTEERKMDTQDKKEEESGKLTDAVKKSTLNPNAKEFTLNPNAKPFQPKSQPMPVPTPPRPQTQSPVAHMPHQQQIPAANMYPNVLPHQQYMRFAKRAVVSVNTPAAQAAAVATGQPLISNAGIPAQQYQPQTLQFVPQHQLMMPTQRMMAPMNPSHPGAEPPQGPPPQIQQQAPPQPQAAMYPVPNMGPHQSSHHSHQQAAPAHGAPHHQTPPHSQPSHMNSQPQQGHPAPSPVQHNPPQPPQPQQTGHPGPHGPHPPTSGTPQPLMYHPHPQAPIQTASPHTPTSPQTTFPPPHPYVSYYNVSQPGPQHVTYMQTGAHTTVTNVSHHQHSHAQAQAQAPPPQHQMHPQTVVMMPQAQQPGNQHAMSHGPPIQAGHIQAPNPMGQPQQVVQQHMNMNLQQIQYVPQMAQQPHPQPIQGNPHNYQ